MSEIKQKLIIMRGLPASGKSTKASDLVFPNEKYYRVNRDLLREMLSFNMWSEEMEKLAVDIEVMAVRKLLNGGYTVIVDDTNLLPKHELKWSNLAKEYGVDFEVIHINTDVDECVRRDKDRGGRKVGEKVIRQMFKQYMESWEEERKIDNEITL